jgi:hypothetical protein
MEGNATDVIGVRPRSIRSTDQLVKSTGPPAVRRGTCRREGDPLGVGRLILNLD